MKIKVCGMRTPKEVKALEQMGVDMIGYVFITESPRYVSSIASCSGFQPDYSYEQYQNMSQGKAFFASDTAPKAARVGVFANNMFQQIVTQVYNHRLNYVQLNGDESITMIENLKRTLIPDITSDIKIIKSIVLCSPEDLLKAKKYEDVADLLLFEIRKLSSPEDTTPLDFTVLSQYKGKLPFILSGDIGLQDLASLASFSHPRWYGINVNRMFEKAPAVKRIDALQTFVTAIRQQERA